MQSRSSATKKGNRGQAGQPQGVAPTKIWVSADLAGAIHELPA